VIEWKQGNKGSADHRQDLCSLGGKKNGRSVSSASRFHFFQLEGASVAENSIPEGKGRKSKNLTGGRAVRKPCKGGMKLTRGSIVLLRLTIVRGRRKFRVGSTLLGRGLSVSLVRVFKL